MTGPLTLEDPLEIPVGFCQCGCGGQTRIASSSNAAYGHVKGQPVRFINGHQNRKVGPAYEKRDCGFGSPCWVWVRCLNQYGYGLLRRLGNRSTLAHRTYYEIVHGAIPDDLEIDHLCRNRACVNPAHLEPVTRAENTRRGTHARLTLAQAKEIKAVLRAAEREGKRRLQGTGVGLARLYGVSPSAIQAIGDGKNWKDA